MPAIPTYTLVTDGASRGNPGPAGIAYAVLDDQGDPQFEDAEPIGTGTNNEAEYKALIEGLRELKHVTEGPLLHVTDSQLLVRQLTGAYQVRSKRLKPLVEQAKALKNEFDDVRHEHVPRTDPRIQRVDELVNQALDEAQSGPSGST